MKNLKNKLNYALTIFVTVLFISCSGDDGVMGPPGADGKDGINGINGQDGKDGKDGNANVITSGWITNPFFGKSGTGGTFPLTGSQNHINENSINKSLVMVYGKNGNSNTADALPTLRDRTIFYSFRITSSNIRVGISSTNGQSMKYDNFSHFRYVIIPPGTANKQEREKLKSASFEEVMDHYEIAY